MQQTMMAQEEEMKVEEVQEGKMADNFFYPDDHADTEIQEYPIPRGCLKFSNTFGHDSYKRYNLWLIDENTVFFGAGISYHFFNIETQDDRIFFSRDGGGIGSVCIHPTRKFYAVAEKGTFPNVFVYSYPDHKLYRILRKGTERSYSSSTFS